MKNAVLMLNWISPIPLFFILFISGCSVPKNTYQKEYGKIWKEIIKSEAWKNTLLAGKSSSASESADFYSSTVDVAPAKKNDFPNPGTEADFPKKYHDLVSRAYFKIIAQAEDADARLKMEHDYWNAESLEGSTKKDRVHKQDLVMVNKRYMAHKAMLEGLRSWNIFSEYRSGDLDFFKAENEKEIHKMMLQGENNDQMVNYLVYKLADLYHFED